MQREGDMSIESRRYRFEDENAHLAFRKRFFPEGSKQCNPEYWRWKYHRHPWTARTGTPPAFVLSSGEEIVGFQGYLPLTGSFRGRQITIGYLVDFYVDPQYRSFPTLNLLRKVTSCADLCIGASLSEDARRLFGAMKWNDLSARVDHFYLHIQRPENYPVWKWAVQTIRNEVVGMLGKGSGNRLAFGAFDELPQDQEIPQVRACGDFSLAKEPDLVRWRYSDCPIVKSRYFGMYRDGKLHAWLAYSTHEKEPGRTAVLVLDVVGGDTNSKRVLLARFVGFLKRNNMASSVTLIGYGMDVAQVCRGVLLGRVGSDIGLMAHTKDADCRDLLTIPGGITFLAGDTDRYR